MMRVIAGSLKGRRLKTPNWDGLRPTADKLRETLFNVLAPKIRGARVADIYAGTGAVGIEALSRGAASVTFVDSDRRAQALISANLAQCGLTTSYTMVRASARRAFDSFDSGVVFDIVWLDPPYGIAIDEVAGVLAAAGDHLAPGGVVVLEHAKRHQAPEAAGRLMRTRQIASGDSALAFYEVDSAASGG